MPEPIDARALPVGSVVAAANAVAIKRYDRTGGDNYWMPAEGYPLPLSDRQMQARIDKDGGYQVLRVGAG
jgi:hypothetical protein